MHSERVLGGAMHAAALYSCHELKESSQLSRTRSVYWGVMHAAALALYVEDMYEQVCSHIFIYNTFTEGRGSSWGDPCGGACP